MNLLRPLTRAEAIRARHEAAGEIYRRMEGLERAETVPALEEVLAALLKN